MRMVSGHRRQRACQLAGLTSMPVIVRNLDRDEATITMVDANLKRENISPMEKARAYEMKLEAMKRKAGRRSKMDILSGEKPMRADEQLAQQVGESRATIQRYTRLTKLEPELQEMVDEKKLPVNTAADISYLKPDEQKKLADAMKREDKVPSGTQAAELKKESQAGKLTAEKIEKTVAPTKREENPELKVTFTNDELRPYFPKKDTTVGDVKRVVFESLTLRQKAMERQQAQGSAGQQKAAQQARPRRCEVMRHVQILFNPAAHRPGYVPPAGWQPAAGGYQLRRAPAGLRRGVPGMGRTYLPRAAVQGRRGCL